VSDAGESGDSSKTSAQAAQAQAPTAPAPVGAPTVVGQSVQNVTDTGATLAATIDPNGSDTHYVVKYGTTSSYGSQTSSIDLGQTPGAQHLTQVLIGLTAGTIYHFQFVATNSQGTSAGADATFTTLAAGTPPPLPPPVQGVSADVLPFLGTVLVNGKPLVAGQQIPFGAVVDTTNGTVLLESLSPSGEPIAAYFAGAIFVLTDGSDGTTTLVLQGGDFSVCSSKSKRQSAGAFGKKKPVIRSLWGNGHGQFATKGRFAAATVRGTIWNTQDRCDGTLITVDRGVVSVFDLVRKKTVTVTAGQSYLVGPPASAARSSVVASPAKVPADGSSSARITVTLRDSAGNPLAGKSVRIGGRNGLTTNADGIASITVSSTHPGTSRYTATDTTDGIQVGTVTVIFTKP
jgi:Big-like domain-containing protein